MTPEREVWRQKVLGRPAGDGAVISELECAESGGGVGRTKRWGRTNKL